MDFFYCRALVIDCKLESKSLIHKTCKSQVEDDDGILFCPLCLQFVDDVELRKRYALLLDDGTAEITAYGTDQVLSNLKETTQVLETVQAHHFAIINFRDSFSIQLHVPDPPINAFARKWAPVK